MRQTLLLAIFVTCCLVPMEGVRAQTAMPPAPPQSPSPPSVSTLPRGPITIDGDVSRPHGPIYTLHRLQVSDVKPTQDIWVLQEQVDYSTSRNPGPVKLHEIAVPSLRSPVLREYVSHMPEWASIVEPGIDTITLRAGEKLDSVSSADLQAFAEFCRSHKIDFSLGILF